MVVGVLALLSIIAVAYVSIGQADRRGSATVVRAVRLDDQRDAVADYLGSLIARDVFSVEWEPIVPGELGVSPASGVYRKVRVQTDYPHTALMRRDPLAPAKTRPDTTLPAWARASDYRKVVSQLPPRLNPNGWVAFSPAGYGDDPWLADAFPSSWDNGSDPFIVITPAVNADDRYRQRVGWKHISCVAPDGRFVNIGTLRPTVQNPRGAFAARPGIAGPGNPGAPDPAARSAQMSWGLGLFDEYGNMSQPTSNNIRLADGSGGFADRNVPAHWSNYQRWLFRPARELPRQPVGGGPNYGPEDLRYLPYQFCDADGDGYFDSRWIELTDSSQRNFVIPGLSLAGPARIFLGVRIIDASALLNVNSATDFGGVGAGANRYDGPDLSFPVGLTPADTDLGRLLRLVDARDTYGATYADLLQSWPATGPQPPTPPAYDYSGYDGPAAQAAGADALTGIWAGASGNLLGLTVQLGAAAAPAPLAQARTGFYLGSGRDPGAARFQAAAAGTPSDIFTFGDPFDSSDLLELLKFRGVNDPTFTSRLESLAAERRPGSNLPTSWDPLRSTRPLLVERDHLAHLPNAAIAGAPGAVDPQGLGLPGDLTLLQSAIDVRSRLTTVNGHRPLLSFDLGAYAPGGVSASPYQERALNPGEVAVSLPAVQRDLRSTDTNVVSAAIQRVFLAYCNALMPALPDAVLPTSGGQPMNEVAWNPAAADFQRLRSLFYGWRGPQLSLRVAAAMTANLIDMIDAPAGGDRPRAYVVPIKTGQNLTDSPDLRVLDLDRITRAGITVNLPPTRLLPAGSPAAANAPDFIRVYGTEAQAFITQAATYTMYTDAPYTGRTTGQASEQDEGWKWIDQDGNNEVNSPPDTIVRNGRVTINGTIDGVNRDFLFQVFAVQLHNPFNYDVNLETYTVQFGNARWSIPAVAAVLTPGQTRTFYATNPHDASVIYTRLQNAAPAGYTPPPFRNWLDAQLTTGGLAGAGGAAPVQLVNRTDLLGNPVPPMNVVDILADRASPDTNIRNHVVLLWRRLSTAGGPGLVNNDLLADRLRDPTMPATYAALAGRRSTFDRRMDARNTEIVNSSTGIDPIIDATPDPANLIGDNTGVTLTLWGAVRRAVDPGAVGAGTTNIPVGAIPAYCLELKDRVGSGPMWALNDARTDTVSDAGNPDISEFTGTQGDRTLGGVLTAQSTTALNPWIKDYPRNFTGTVVRRQGDPGNLTPQDRPYDEVYPEIHLLNATSEATADFDGPDAGGLPPTAPPQTFSRLRLADVVLPMAVAAWWEPMPGTNVSSPYDSPPRPADGWRIEAEWTTLSEALALGMHYDWPGANSRDYFVNPPYPSSRPDPRQFLYEQFGRRVADRGHLRLDDFVPFFNGDGALAAGWPEYNPSPAGAGNPADRDHAVFPRIPMALAVLDQFNALERGSATVRINGTNNLNTEPLEVTRTHPLLSPDKTASWIGKAMGAYRSAGGTVTNVNLFNLSSSSPDTFDVAATLHAYRERDLFQTRPAGSALNGTGPVVDLDFRDSAPALLLPDGRFRQTGISGLREQPGFRSLGEVLCARLNNPAMIASDRARADNSIDRFARLEAGPSGEKMFFRQRAAGDNTPLNGIDTSAYRVPGGAATQVQPDEIPGDYDKQLTIANAVLNTVGVRSDVFICWFVIQGYLPSDVEGFSADPNDPRAREPMVPSINRRFVMVLDRSNVVREGDKPKVLLLKEVPN
jgi:hypothetical protein